MAIRKQVTTQHYTALAIRASLSALCPVMRMRIDRDRHRWCFGTDAALMDQAADETCEKSVLNM